MSKFNTTVNRDLILQLMGYSDDGNDKLLMGYAHTLAQLLLERDDVATRFVAHTEAIWNAAFPDDPNGWEYGGQIERCVIDEITNLRTENDHLWKAHTLLMQLHDTLEGAPIQSNELAGILDNVDQYLRDEALEGGE